MFEGEKGSCFMRLEEIINKYRQNLNDTDMVIWKYILNHRAAARHISIHELARDCAVSSTTIVRFAQKLGFDGFGELKAVLKMETPVPTDYSKDVLNDMGQFYDTTWRKLITRNYDDASRLVHESNRIFAHASGFVQETVVQELKRLFFYDNVLIYNVQGRSEMESILRTLTPDDLFIFVSLSGETASAVEFARELRLRDVPVISITQLHDTTLASLSTANLYVSPAQFQLYSADEERTPYKSMMPYFMLVELWYIKYRLYLQAQKEAAEKAAQPLKPASHQG